MNNTRSSGGGDGTWIWLVVFGTLFVVGWLLWWLHRLVAWAVLWLMRDALVYLFGDDLMYEAEEEAVIFWRLLMPILLFACGFGFVFSQLANPQRDLPWLLNLPLSATAGAILVYHFQQLYQQYPPKHPTWVRFVAAEVKLRTRVKLAWIEGKLRWRL